MPQAGPALPQEFPGSPAQVVLTTRPGAVSRNKGIWDGLNPHGLVLDRVPFKNRRGLQNNHDRSVFPSHPCSWDE